ncbi:MAG TPA: hypothetical protein VFF11_08955 [Candidatus Binatia bacterium]|nr:hypothetical protein [Candidatus Binatia bacterium]
MKLTPNKTHLALGIAMVFLGLCLMATAFMAQGRRYGHFSVEAVGPIGILMVIGGAGLLFGSPKSK